MSAIQFEQPECPHCGEEFDGTVTTPFWRWADCGFCLRRFQVPGNPCAPLPAFHRPFWTDQFRMGREDSTHPPAELDGLMLTIVGLFGLCGLITVAIAVVALVRSICPLE